MTGKIHIVSRPGGLTVKQYKSRHKKTATENMATRNHFKNGSSVKFGWLKIQKTGLNTSGPYSGLRASSFNNPPMGPPVSAIEFNERKTDAQTSIPICVEDLMASQKVIYSRDWKLNYVHEIVPSQKKYEYHARRIS